MTADPDAALREALTVALQVALHETFDPGCTGEPPYDSSMRLAEEVTVATMRSPLLRAALAATASPGLDAAFVLGVVATTLREERVGISASSRVLSELEAALAADRETP